jgi:type IV pilus assembly protein PilQ
LPQQTKQDLSIKEFAEQNSFIIWGDADIISNFIKTLEKIDVVVPVILIDVIIVDAGKNFEIETGLEAGIKDTPTATSGTINPGLDYTMGAASVNNLLSRIGLTNLGKVTPNFYVKLKAMETDGILEIRSTPQLSTMNGHSAKMSIGQTEYYKEEMSNMFGYQNPQLQTQTMFKPVEAQLAVNIKPFVTGNGQVSLTIEVEQSQFTARIDEFAPPGLESRKFSSMIRVRNQEMILLGGLEENTNSSTRKGWPFLSRVPVLNLIFSHKTEKNNKSHLNIFIKPTVIY